MSVLLYDETWHIQDKEKVRKDRPKDRGRQTRTEKQTGTHGDAEMARGRSEKQKEPFLIKRKEFCGNRGESLDAKANLMMKKQKDASISVEKMAVIFLCLSFAEGSYRQWLTAMVIGTQ